MKKPIVLLVLSFCFVHCENTFTPEYTLAWEPPVVNQVISTDEGGYWADKSVEFGLPVWKYKGAVSYIDFNEIKDFYASTNPIYTEDFEEGMGVSTYISFSVETTEKIRISILPARLPDEDPEEVWKKFTGAAYKKIRLGGIVLLDATVVRGSHAVRFDPIKYALPSGFYTYTLERGTEIITRTMYILNDCNEIEPELYGFQYMCVNDR